MLSQQHPGCRRDAVGPWGAQLKSSPPSQGWHPTAHPVSNPNCRAANWGVLCPSPLSLPITKKRDPSPMTPNPHGAGGGRGGAQHPPCCRGSGGGGERKAVRKGKLYNLNL